MKEDTVPHGGESPDEPTEGGTADPNTPYGIFPYPLELDSSGRVLNMKSLSLKYFHTETGENAKTSGSPTCWTKSSWKS